jgi:hypothetical protein
MRYRSGAAILPLPAYGGHHASYLGRTLPTSPERITAQHQALLHFVGQGPWSDKGIRRLSPTKSSGGLTAAITKDLLAEAAEPVAERPNELGASLDRCFSCGQGIVYRPSQDDASGRFCSDRCREWFDAGNPPWFENPGFRPAFMGDALYGLWGWKVVAGPPGIEIGSEYCAGIIAASDRKRAELEGRDLIRPRRLCRCGRRIPSSAETSWEASGRLDFMIGPPSRRGRTGLANGR